MKPVLTTCPYCGTGCMFHLLMDERGRAAGVLPALSSPPGKYQMCVKGWNAHSFVNHPDRLTAPLLRKDGEQRPASWEEALDTVVARLKAIQQRYGNDAIAIFASGKITNEENFLAMKLARAVFGTNNIDQCARLCHSSTVVGLNATLGSGAMTNSIACIEHTDCIFVMGSNTTEQHPIIGAKIVNAVQRGAKLIVADSREIRLARHAGIHLRHRNGTDVALLNGLMHVILRDGLEDRAFIEARTENVAAMRETALKYTPEIVAGICGVDPEAIVRAAHLYAEAGRAMIFYSMGITQHTHGTNNVKSIANLALLTGNLGRPGTGVNPLRGQNNVQGACDMGALPNVFSGYQNVDDPDIRARFAKAWGVARLPDTPGLTMTAATNAAAAGTLKGMYIIGENPMMSAPDQGHAAAALRNLEFLAVQDIFPTPTSALADVVLPAASYAEKDGSSTTTERRIQRVRKAMEPVGGSRADWEILCEVAERAGYAGMRYAGPQEIMDEIAALTPIYGGVSYERLETSGLQWPCPDARHPGTPVLHMETFARGRGCFAPAEQQPSAEQTDTEYPLLLTTGRSYFHYHTGTMTRRTRLLDREERSPLVGIHPADARRLDVSDRQPVVVATRRGAVHALARVTEAIIPGVIFMTFHFEEGPANALTHNALDCESGIPEYKVCAAKVSAAP